MSEFVKKFIRKNWDIILYIILGGLTTVVNYCVYIPCYNIWGMSAVVSNMLSWVAAVMFAYLTNKPFVFHSNDWSAGTVGPEFTRFVGCRLASGVLETVFLFITVDLLHWNGNILKLFTSVMVVILNYVASKLLVFRKK